MAGLTTPISAQGRAAGGEDAGPVAGQPVDPLDDLAGGAGLGDRQVPDLAGGFGVGAQRDQRGGDVGRVGVAVERSGSPITWAVRPVSAVPNTVSPRAERVVPGPK